MSKSNKSAKDQLFRKEKKITLNECTIVRMYLTF